MKTKAAVLYRSDISPPYGQSRPLKIEELELDGPGPGEALVEIAAAGLCHSDLSVIDGSRIRPLPMAMGHEAAGIVREVGAGVSQVQVGDHVVCSYVPVCGRCLACLSGRAALCQPGNMANRAGSLLSGARRLRHATSGPIHHHLGVSAFSQYAVTSANSLVAIDSQIPLDIAVLFGCAVMTGVGAVVNTARVHPGSTVAVFGMGGVGLSAIMGAKVSGASTIIAVDVNASKLELARQAGATHVINGRECDAVEAIRDVTAGGVDFSLEAVGNERVLAQAFQSLAWGGKAVAIGLPHPDKLLSIPVLPIVSEERSIVGSYMGSCVPQRDIPRFMRMYQGGACRSAC